MKNIIESFYKRLPIVRELIAVQQSIEKIAATQFKGRVLNASQIVQALNIIKQSNPRYTDPQRLLVYGSQYWSQNYEDGMIEEIFRRVAPAKRTFLEIGVGDGSENNTTYLLAQGWKGWWIEGNSGCCKTIETLLKIMPTLAKQLKVHNSLVSPSNIKKLLDDLEIPYDVDLFSLDIDLDTYHIWAALSEFKPRVVVVEYNASLGPSLHWIHPYLPNQMWNGTQAFGASLKAYENLGRDFGYTLVGCDLIGINAFFVRTDLINEAFCPPFTSENHYEPPRYHLLYRWGHPSTFFGESHK